VPGTVPDPPTSPTTSSSELEVHPVLCSVPESFLKATKLAKKSTKNSLDLGKYFIVAFVHLFD
jgi:hypothetical protein